MLIWSDSAGATHGFAAECRATGVGFSFGFPVTAPVRAAVATTAEAATQAARHGRTVWYPAIEADGRIRDGAWLAEVTGLIDLSAWPPRTRLILRKERPHPGAQLTFADADGDRVTFITDTPIGAVPGQLAGWTCGTGNTPGSRTGSGRPKRPVYGTCPVTPGRPIAPGWRSC